MKNWWIGCSGFYYKHWREKFYPPGLPQRKWFEYYCTFFSTIELNVTFYRYPKLEALQSWYQRSPDHFRFTVKAPRLITHFKKFNNARRETQDFYELVASGLKDKMGCVLFQLPPNLTYSAASLEKILTTMDPAFNNVVEFRHESWWNEHVYRTLKQHNTTFCSISFPSLPDSVVNGGRVLYYRFHGVPDLYASPYTKEKLKQVHDDIMRARGTHDIYVYFNNDIHAEAIHDAQQLIQMTRA